MRLSRLAMGLSGVIVLSLAVLVGVGSAHSNARQSQPTITVAPVILAGWLAQRSLVRGLTFGAVK
jgi:ABC-type glycerol-3-phosphate transport system permease component